MIDNYSNTDHGSSSEYFYSSLQEQWRAEGHNIEHPDWVYCNHELLLHFQSQNRYDWDKYMTFERFKEATLGTLRPGFLEPVLEWVDACKTQPTNLAFVGDNGKGKTHTCIAAARFMSLHGVLRKEDDLYMPTSRMLECVDAHNVLDAWSKTQNASSAVEKYKNIPLLLVDDLGAVSTSAQAAISNIVSIISHRYNLNLPTIVTANQKPDELSAMYGSTTIRRIFTDSTVIAATP